MFSPPPTPADEKTLARNYIYAVSAGISGHAPDSCAPCTRGDQPRLIENPATPAPKTIYTRFPDCWHFESVMITTAASVFSKAFRGLHCLPRDVGWRRHLLTNEFFVADRRILLFLNYSNENMVDR